MAPRKDDVHEIMAQSQAERQAMFEPVSELSRRLQPRHLADVTSHYVQRKVTGVIGGVSEAIKDNGGTAAGLALGAIAVFDVGRRSVDGAATSANGAAPGRDGGLTSEQDPHSASAPAVGHSPKTVTNMARTKVLAGSAGGLLLGHLLARAFHPTAKEHELFGKASGEIRDAASEFISRHSHGAKLVAAQAFGFARYSAAFLALMAAASEYFGRSAGDPPNR